MNTSYEQMQGLAVVRSVTKGCTLCISISLSRTYDVVDHLVDGSRWLQSCQASIYHAGSVIGDAHMHISRFM